MAVYLCKLNLTLREAKVQACIVWAGFVVVVSDNGDGVYVVLLGGKHKTINL